MGLICAVRVWRFTSVAKCRWSGICGSSQLLQFRLNPTSRLPFGSPSQTFILIYGNDGYLMSTDVERQGFAQRCIGRAGHSQKDTIAIVARLR